jgi:quercetin dioxygenase-like cupin family protein
LVHGKRVDFMIIRDGGVSKVVKPGDVVYVPAGVPHYFSEIPDHVTEILVRWDVK